ncbi:MAG: ATP-dependent zinc metalloprotease FtsH [Candidatus Nanoperiomorbaceae bacterium]
MNPRNPRGKRPANLTPTSQSPRGRRARNIVFYIIIILLALVIFAAVRPSDHLQTIPFSQLVKNVNEGKVAKVVESGQDLTITLKGQKNPTETSMVPQGASSAQQGLDITKVNYVAQTADNTSDILWNVAGVALPIIVIVALFVWMMRSAGAQGNQSLAFGRSKAKLYGKDKKTTTFTDIAGNDEAKDDLTEVVDFLKHPKKFASLGAKIPKGVLMVGPPGTGKTMLARAVAGEANVPFFSISGSEFVEMFVGVGASRVRDLFEKAKKNAPCIIFIDEIDAVGRRRGSGMGGGHDEREQTLNQILVEMDGFDEHQTVIVLAATNRADVLDPALLRPGRFDRRVTIALPERRDREAILKVHEKGKPVAKSVDLDALAAKTAGMSGADLANVMNEAAIKAARQNEKEISDQDVTEAFEKVSIGPERKNKVMNDKDKELTAYHEGGHALVAQILPDSDDVHKVTIIPRGGTGGVTWTLPSEDRPYTSIVEFKDILAKALGGRISEEIVYGRDHITTGAGSDLRNATSIARDMIIEQGMGTRLRDQVFHEDEGGLMMDRIAREKPYSEKTAEEIDREVNELIEEAANRARVVISENREYLNKLKDALLEKETLDADQVKTLLHDAQLPDAARLY